ncbi:MAG: hypothetical protein PVS3B2_21910 [Candidatus Dormibacteraceae bacterium]
MFAAALREPDDKFEVRGDQAFLACLVAKRRLVEESIPLGAAQGFGHPGLLHDFVQGRGIAVDKVRATKVFVLALAGAHGLNFTMHQEAASERLAAGMFHVLHRQGARWIAILDACAGRRR